MSECRRDEINNAMLNIKFGKYYKTGPVVQKEKKPLNIFYIFILSYCQNPRSVQVGFQR